VAYYSLLLNIIKIDQYSDGNENTAGIAVVCPCRFTYRVYDSLSFHLAPEADCATALC
jgi:hypothetical protein